MRYFQEMPAKEPTNDAYNSLEPTSTPVTRGRNPRRKRRRLFDNFDKVGTIILCIGVVVNNLAHCP